MPELTLVALGGNALIRPGQRGTLDEQAANLRESLAIVVELIRGGGNVILTHGNGPQVGAILLRAEAARGEAYDLPLDVCVAQSQGEMGYLITQCLGTLLRDADVERDICALVTRTVVDTNDARLSEASKPIGPFLTTQQAESLRSRGVLVVDDAGRGWRRVVPSPRPVRVIEIEDARRLASAGTIVIAAGGGGIPVSEIAPDRFAGVEAVVDKDLTGALLAADLGAVRVIDITAVDHVKLNYGKPNERDLSSLTVAEAQRYLAEGHFAPGSMAPKIEGAIWFIEHGGRDFIVTRASAAVAALKGDAGTRIIAG